MMQEADKRPRILIVDDEENIVQILADFFEDRPYAVETVGTGESALDRVRAGGYNLIMTDINLPGISGLEVLAAAKESDPDVVVVIMTGFASTGSAIQALREGAFEYVTKPFDLFDVDKIVARGLESRELVVENRRLLHDLQIANEELRRHEEELTEKVASATRKIRTLYDISKDVNASLDVTKTLHFIVGQAAALTGARMGLLFRASENTHSMTAVVGYGIASELAGVAKVDAEGGVNGRVLATRETVRASASRAEDFGEEVLERLEATSVLAVPLINKGNLIGVLNVMDKEGGTFEENDEELLVAFASQAAMALANADLYEHARQLDSLKNDFVAVVSHEIRTPLTSIQGSLELVLDHGDFGDQENIRELIEIGQTNAERLRILIGDILDFSKLERDRLPLTFEEFALPDLCAEVVAAMRNIADRKRIVLRRDVARDVGVVTADRVRIGQVLTNLIHNAIKFTPEEGRVELTVDNHPGEAVLLTVTDSGPGIAAENMGKLFQKFQQIDPSLTRTEGGLGLGLVISKGIVEGHGGRIWVESEPGDGCRFSFVIPCEPPSAAHGNGGGSERVAAKAV